MMGYACRGNSIVELTIYSRRGCCLCDELKDLIRHYAQATGREGTLALEEREGLAGHVDEGIDPAGLELSQRLGGVDGQHLARRHAGEVEEPARGEEGAAAFTTDGDPRAGELIEGGDLAPGEDVDLLVVVKKLLAVVAAVRLYSRSEPCQSFVPLFVISSI